MPEDDRDEKVKVVDRRWFTAEGELKEPTPAGSTDAAPAAPAPPQSPPQSPPESPPESPPPSPAPPPHPQAGGPQPARAGTDQPPADVGFLDLVDFLAQQSVALMSGQVPGRGRDPATARFFIDLLGVVQEKTSGQLAPEETRYLEDVLFQLRSLFVAATR